MVHGVTAVEGDARELRHVPALDGLRGVAVLLVVLYHTAVLVNPTTETLTTVRGFGWLNSFARGGFLGVDVFFVLSGFLITSLLLGDLARSGAIGFRRFYRRRALRLLPALVVLLIAHLVYSCFATDPGHGRAIPLRQELNTIASALTYVLNYVASFRPNSIALRDLGHLWSLSVEEQFYLLWPAVLAVVVRRRTNVVPRVIWAGIVVVVAERLLLSANPHVDLYMRTDARADSLLIGALLRVVMGSRRAAEAPRRVAPWCATGVIVWFIATSRTTSPLLFNGGFTLFAAAVAVILLAIVDGGWGSAFRSRPIRAVDAFSYGLYLWHVPIFVAITRSDVAHDPTVRLALGYALTALATYLSWTFVEKPALARRH